MCAALTVLDGLRGVYTDITVLQWEGLQNGRDGKKP